MPVKRVYNKSTGREYGPDSYDGKYRAAHKADNAQRKAARRSVEKKLGKAAVKGKDVDHVRPVKSGGSNAPANLKAQSVAKNRGRKP